jgi:antirestriction protein ArdC
VNRGEVYAKVTQGILDRLQRGAAPWHQPWNPVYGRPRNLDSKRLYSGVNAFALGLMGASPYWLTLKQVNHRGLRLRAGCKGVPILYYQAREIEEPGIDPTTGQPAMLVREVPFLRYYHVFNAVDVVGLELPKPEAPAWQGVAAAEAIEAAIRPVPVVQHGADRACFQPGPDVILMPHPESFRRPVEYHATKFHELTHWTGHASRLNRNTMNGMRAFGDPFYSQEELVAEMGAGFLCALAGIENQTIDQSAAYIANWLQALRNDPGMVVRAAANAQRAVDFLCPQPAARAPDGAAQGVEVPA